MYTVNGVNKIINQSRWVSSVNGALAKAEQLYIVKFTILAHGAELQPTLADALLCK